MEKSILLTCILIGLLFIYTIFARPLPLLSPITVLDSIRTLSDSGYIAMSLTVKSECKTLLSQYSSITVFAPPDAVFQASGKPPVSLLLFHFSPLKLSIKKLKSLPFGTRIPTLFDDKELILTSTPLDDHVSLNNVTILESAIFDVGTMVVYGIDKFFDPSFANSWIPTPVVRNPINNLRCKANEFTAYQEIAEKLLDTQYSVIGEFFDLLVHRVTVFAPDNDDLHNQLANLTDTTRSILLRYMVPCKLTYKNLFKLHNGTEIPTFCKGFRLKIIKSSEGILINGIRIVYPEVLSSDRIVIHGIEKLFELTKLGIKGGSAYGCQSNHSQTVEETGFRVLYCDKRTTIFCLLQVFFTAIGIGLYILHNRYPERLVIRQYPEGFLILTHLLLEFGGLCFEYKGNSATLRSLTLPKACLSGYVTFLEYYYYANNKAVVYRILDVSLLFLTTELMIYLRISDFIFEPIPLLVESVGRSVFGIFFVMHFAEGYSYLQATNDFGRFKAAAYALMFSMIGVYGYTLI